MKIGIWIGIAVLVIVIIYLVMNNSKKTAAANAVIAAAENSNTSNTSVCIPFTKAQQDAEKRSAQAKCANKLIIPFVGPAQYAACMKNVSVGLTPVTNC